jgi:hypothetical protein
MSDPYSRPGRAPRRGFLPAVISMERRRLMSADLFASMGHPIARAIRGVAVQTGTVLTVTVDRPTTDAVQVSNLGAGNIGVAWNGSGAHSFSGITTIDVHAEEARNDQITFNLNAGPSSLTDLTVCARALDAPVAARVDGHARLQVTAPRIGVAIQRGTALFVTVKKPTSNTVNILDNGDGDLQVHWNGSSVHTFANIDTVSVHAEDARNAQVTLGWSVS